MPAYRAEPGVVVINLTVVLRSAAKMLRGTVWVAAAALAAMCLAPTHGAGADGWCGPAAYNGTRCNATVATCCDFHWSPNGKGCCAMPNAVCCANGYTCCPEGHTCQDQGSGWGVVTTCVPSGAAGAAGGDGAGLLGEQICKPGPPLPLDPARKNVVVMVRSLRRRRRRVEPNGAARARRAGRATPCPSGTPPRSLPR